MSRFLDGPAAGINLMLRRAPVFLRVTLDRAAKWDGLDQLGDTPNDDEQIFVYRRQGEPTRMHLLIRGKGKAGGGWYEMGEYRFWPEQPTDEQMRHMPERRAWCVAQQQKEKATS